MARQWLLLLIALVVGWVLGYVQGRKAAGAGPVQVPGPGEMPEVEDLMRQRRKIDAIKLYRERTGAGLGEAKEVVEAIGRRLQAQG